MQLIASSEQRIYKSLEEYPYPAWSLTGQTEYRVIMTSRGCPYRCTFCASDILNVERFTVRSVDSVVQEIEVLLL